MYLPRVREMRSALVLLLLVLIFIVVVVLIFVLVLVLIVLVLVLIVLVLILILVLVLHNEHSFFVIWNYVLIMPRIALFYSRLSLNCHKRWSSSA